MVKYPGWDSNQAPCNFDECVDRDSGLLNKNCLLYYALRPLIVYECYIEIRSICTFTVYIASCMSLPPVTGAPWFEEKYWNKK